MRDIFVFCGQSNMMGACDTEPKHTLKIKSSVEFKYRQKYLKRGEASFVPLDYNCGEFLYCSPKAAYPLGEEKSDLADYQESAMFVPAMAGNKSPFKTYSENNYITGPCVIPYFCERYEELGESPIVAHIAKGQIKISHYFNQKMFDAHNAEANGKKLKPTAMELGASKVFEAKCKELFERAEEKFEIGKKAFVWLQGESDWQDTEEEYRLKLEILYAKVKELGFDIFLMLRVGYWNSEGIINVIRAQEAFCKSHGDCFMASRAVSYMDNISPAPPSDWFKKNAEVYKNCRDTYFGSHNFHINENGFMILGKELAENVHRILKLQKPPTLGEEKLAMI